MNRRYVLLSKKLNAPFVREWDRIKLRFSITRFMDSLILALFKMFWAKFSHEKMFMHSVFAVLMSLKFPNFYLKN